MPFSAEYPALLANPTPLMRRFMALLDENVPLETLAQKSQRATRQNFGKTMRLFAPLYVSNECVNNCSYCGFSRDAAILRTTLTVDQVVTEAKHLHAQGFRNLLLVAGEHPKFVSEGYLQKCLDALIPLFPTLALEVTEVLDVGKGVHAAKHGADGHEKDFAEMMQFVAAGARVFDDRE